MQICFTHSYLCQLESFSDVAPPFSLTVSAVRVYTQVDCTVCRPVCFLRYLDTFAVCVCECVH